MYLICVIWSMIVSKRTILTSLFAIFSISLMAQVFNSVLSEGNWYKFSVDTTGVFKIDRNLLQQIGISTNNIDPGSYISMETVEISYLN